MNVVSEIKQMWVDQWCDSKLFCVLDVIGVALGISGALILSLTADNPQVVLVFLIFGLSSICFIATSWYRRLPMVMLLMIFYLCTDVVGLSIIWF